MSRSPVPFLAVALFGLLAGCASGGPSGSGGAMAAVAPVLSVERFLQAANTRDLDAMSRIFGTADGPIADQAGNTFSCAFKRMGSWIGIGERCASWVDIELRMDAIAGILEHDDYLIETDNTVPGRTRPTRRIGVQLTRGATRYNDVPFVVVQTSDGRWLVEEIDLARMTAFREPGTPIESSVIVAVSDSPSRVHP